jgi:tRNA (guanine-N7-)-methyltransferase
VGRGLNYDIPGEDWRRSVAEIALGGWESVFAGDLGPPLRLVIEIGFGRGEFLLELAAKHPDTAFVGIEVSFKRVLKLARKLARSELRNVRLAESRGQVVVAECCAPASVDEFWINFSDPWPKDRHAHRRFIQSPTVAAIGRALRPGGLLHVATDDVPYAQQIGEVLEAEPSLENLFAPDRFRPEIPGRLRTAYEEGWREAGRALHFFEYRRAETDAPGHSE